MEHRKGIFHCSCVMEHRKGIFSKVFFVILIIHCSCANALCPAQWFLTWGNLPPGVNFTFRGGKFTES